MKRIIVILLVIWLGAYLASVIIPATMEPSGDGFTRGLNRVGVFFGWQIAAGVLGLVIWLAARGADLSRTLRWLCRIPMILAGAMFLFVIGLIVWANFINAPPPSAYEYREPAAPATEPVQPVNPSG